VKAYAHPVPARSRWLKLPVNSGPYRHWLIDKASLTRRLQSNATDFSVHPVRVLTARPYCDEAQLLGLPHRKTALLREVQLCRSGRPVVFAHSVLPHESLRGAWQGLSRLGTKSLGTTLFTDARVRRTPLEYRKLNRQDALYRKAVAALVHAPVNLWARRSAFKLKHAMILVTEVFLPSVLTL